MNEDASLESNPVNVPLEEDEDSYFDGPYLVFTAAYHLKRGYCCQSGCRHCPYVYDKNKAATAIPPDSQQK